MDKMQQYTVGSGEAPARLLTYEDMRVIEEFLGLTLQELAGEIHRVKLRGLEPAAILAPVPELRLMGLPVRFSAAADRWELVLKRPS